MCIKEALQGNAWTWFLLHVLFWFLCHSYSQRITWALFSSSHN